MFFIYLFLIVKVYSRSKKFKKFCKIALFSIISLVYRQTYALVAQLEEYRSSKPRVAGSIPAECTMIFLIGAVLEPYGLTQNEIHSFFRCQVHHIFLSVIFKKTQTRVWFFCGFFFMNLWAACLSEPIPWF